MGYSGCLRAHHFMQWSTSACFYLVSKATDWRSVTSVRPEAERRNKRSVSCLSFFLLSIFPVLPIQIWWCFWWGRPAVHSGTDRFEIGMLHWYPTKAPQHAVQARDRSGVTVIVMLVPAVNILSILLIADCCLRNSVLQRIRNYSLPKPHILHYPTHSE